MTVNRKKIISLNKGISAVIRQRCLNACQTDDVITKAVPLTDLMT